MMTLQKDKWQIVKLSEIFKLKSGNALPQSKIIPGNNPVYGGNGIIGHHNSFMVDEPTIVIGRVGEYCGTVHLTKTKAWITDNGLYPVEYFQKVDKYFFRELLQNANLNRYAQKTGQPSISQTTLYQIEIPLPPLDEQQRIADLFQSLDQSLAHVEEQEGHVKALRKALSSGLASVPPVFGNVLSAQNSQSCSFGEMCECIEQHDKTPMESGLTRFVGLEHIEPENFMLQGCGKIADGTTFTKRFAKGDVLFGKRRAYLKKVAVADYDGICSSDILVFRARQDRLLPELLPYYVSSEAFIAHAVSTSAGSLSPRTKWRDLAGVELSIPDMQAQTQIADVLQHLETTVTHLKTQTRTLNTLKQKLLNEMLG